MHLDALERVITHIVAPAATTTDELGIFPRPAITALGEAGILDFVGRSISGLPLLGPPRGEAGAAA
jgi:hypothetical protein